MASDSSSASIESRPSSPPNSAASGAMSAAWALGRFRLSTISSASSRSAGVCVFMFSVPGMAPRRRAGRGVYHCAFSFRSSPLMGLILSPAPAGVDAASDLPPLHLQYVAAPLDELLSQPDVLAVTGFGRAAPT